ncbi:DUF4279 domain-containing protein [Aquimarina sp. 2304DJ70-9]|uniref:DUF4279 domain-containing protein n=1 Tax=Aquimarina penaris TaxID=3231044 RepID=UPI0034617DC0
MKEKLIERAIAEIEKPTFGTTEQYLEVHSVQLKNGKPKVERVDFKSFEKVNAVYFPIAEEPFFLVIYFSKENNKLVAVDTENGNRIYLTATSDKLTFDELSKLTKLKPLTGWSIDDLRANGKSRYNFSRISFEPIKSNAYELEPKLKMLLTELEKDIDGIKKLIAKSNVIISIFSQQYICGNKGIHFDTKIISRMNNLNLGIDIDQSDYGNELKSVL